MSFGLYLAISYYVDIYYIYFSMIRTNIYF